MEGNLYVVTKDEKLKEEFKKIIGEMYPNDSIGFFSIGADIWQSKPECASNPTVFIGHATGTPKIFNKKKYFYDGFGIKIVSDGNKCIILFETYDSTKRNELYEAALHSGVPGIKTQGGKIVVPASKKGDKDLWHQYGLYKFCRYYLESFMDATYDDAEPEKVEKIKPIDAEMQKTIAQYNMTYADVNSKGLELYNNRTRIIDLIGNIEVLINSIANRPKSFDTEMGEIAEHSRNFVDIEDRARIQLNEARKSAIGASAGVAVGAIASVAPSAAMWVATTFGTAATGTAISSLSGAAATNAALAWIGGGAISAGGGGMAAGSAFMVLAGPIGWGIAGATLLASITIFVAKKNKLNKEKEQEIEYILQNKEKLSEIVANIDALLTKTKWLWEGVDSQFKECMALYGKNYDDITENEQQKLGALVNNTKAVSVLIDRSI